MDKNIILFIESQKTVTLCTVNNGIPHCASCFYAFIKDYNFLIIKSDKKTMHIVNALANNQVAGTILPDISRVGTIKGVQFYGIFTLLTGELLTKSKSIYYKKFPIALAINGDLWAIELASIKMTDNTLGFGKKLIWEKEHSNNI